MCNTEASRLVTTTSPPTVADQRRTSTGFPYVLMLHSQHTRVISATPRRLELTSAKVFSRAAITVTLVGGAPA
jgi:hypothetical protein